MRTHRKKRPARTRSWLRVLVLVCAGIVALAVLANAVMWVAYRGRLLPNYSVGTVQVGNMRLDDARQALQKERLLPEKVTLTMQGSQYEVTPETLGVQADVAASVQSLEERRPWLPLVAVFRHTNVPVVLDIDRSAFDAALSAAADELYIEPLPHHIVFEDEAFVIADPSEGYRADESRFEAQLLATIQNGRSNMAVPAVALEPPSSTDLSGELARLQAQLAARVNYRFGAHSQAPAVREIGNWYVRDGHTMQASETRIGEYVQAVAGHFGVTPANIRNAVAATLYALDSARQIDFLLTAQNAPVRYTYCTAVRGVGDEQLAAFSHQAAAVLGDPRGWTAGGMLSFEYVDSNCDFTLWLAAPAEVPGFGWPCDSEWSCRVGRNVIINFDRWQHATAPWNAAGMSLTDYHALVINHETGHWLGFGHLACPGPGQPAPVMMQQSIEMNGCTFNPWPVESELNTAKRERGLAALPPREDELLATAPCCCAHCSGGRAS